MEPPVTIGATAPSIARSLPKLATCLLGIQSPDLGAAAGNAGERWNFDEVMDDFIEEHRKCYEFRDAQCGPGQQDRYVLIFQALQRELCWMRWPCARPRAIRVLQCLRLLTRDADLQLSFFEGNSSPSNARGDAHRAVAKRGELPCEHRERERDRGDTDRERERDRTGAPDHSHRVAASVVERGRERGPLLPPTVPATSSRAVPHPPAVGGARPSVAASPRRSKYQSPDGRCAALGVSPRRFGNDEHCNKDDGYGERVRLPPLALDLASPRLERGSSQAVEGRGCDGGRSEEGNATPSSAALLRLFSELVAEYLADNGCGSAGYAAARAPELRATDVAVTGACVAEIVSMLNRYATTEPRRSRLAQLGVLRPLASLLSGATDMVLRCALETLVHFTTHKNTDVLAAIAVLSLRDPKEEDVSPLSGHSAGLLRHCLGLLGCQEEMFEGLAAQLLEQLLEAPDLRLQLRRIPGALPILLASLRIDAPARAAVGRGASSVERGRAGSPTPRGGASQMQAFKRVRILRCCQRLARDHVELGDPLAVQNLREQGLLEAIVTLLRHGQRDLREAETLNVALDTLAQMCMDDECGFAMRSHVEGIAALGCLLFDAPWRPTDGQKDGTKAELPGSNVQRAAVRLLRFLFAVERNRKAFKHVFSPELFGHFIDIGNYVWPLESYGPFIGAINGLAEGEVAQIRSDYLRSFERGMMMRMAGDSTEARFGVAQTDGQVPELATSPVARRAGSLGVAEGRPHQLVDSAASGRIVSGYELLECVGAGAFGRVHLARKRGESIDYALKEVPLTPLSDSIGWPPARQPKAPTQTPGPHGRRPNSRTSSRGRTSPETALPEAGTVECAGEGGAGEQQVANDISREVQLLRQLDHPNIVRYYDSFTIGLGATSTLWIVMEYCSGVSLQSLTASKREKGFGALPEEQTWQIFVQLCLALRYLHIEKRIAHRDLTPNNVLVQAHTLATKIADFGLARQKAIGLGTKGASMMRSMVGTILYSCPEIVQHKPYTHKTDVWALGCLLYKMATLSDPFSGTNPLSVARKIVECDYNPLDPRHHSEMLINTCRQCLVVTPEARPDIQQVCQLIMTAMVHHLESLERTVMGQPPVQSPSQQRTLQLPPPVPTAPTSAASTVSRASVEAHPDDLSPVLPARPKHIDQPAPGGGASSIGGTAAEGLRESGQSVLSGISEHSVQTAQSAQSVQTALSVQSAQTAPTVKSVQSEQSARSQGQEQEPGVVQVPRHMLGGVVDPLQKALQVVHQLVFLQQMPPGESPLPGEVQRVSMPKRRAVAQYQQWLFGSIQGASVMKREMSRLMQRSSELVDCSGPDGASASEYYTGDLSALSLLTYESLHDYIDDLCVLQGYDTAVPSSTMGGSSSSDTYNG